jgi:alpha-L-rhamnosidase
MRLTDLKCDHLREPLGLTNRAPRLSWAVDTDRPGWRARRQRVRIWSADARAGAPLYDGGWREGSFAAEVCVGADLRSRARYIWRVEVEGADSRTASAESHFEMGLCSADDWTARFVGLPRPYEDHDDHRPCTLLRRAFELPARPRQARLYITAAGVHRTWINGRSVSDALFRPGWTDYAKRLLVDAYDVTALLTPGRNVIASLLGDGWFSGVIGFERQRDIYGRRTGLLAQLEIALPDGRAEIVATDGAWRASFGPILASDRYAGEIYDQRLELGSWQTPEFDASGWRTAEPFEPNVGRLEGAAYPPVQVVDTVAPVATEAVPDGDLRLDFGVNLTGWARLRLRGRPGQIVRLQFAEHRDGQGALYRANLNGARCTDLIVSAGEPLEWEPSFTYRGFRHVRITGAEANQIIAAEARVARTAAARTGAFACSEPVLNTLFEMIRRSHEANLFEVMTDCPQRDERLGWLGDAHQFLPTACRLSDMAAFLRKWCADIRDAQGVDGAFPPQAPAYRQYPEPFRRGFPELTGAVPGWSDGGTLIPWIAWEHTGDSRFVEEAYPSMAAWANFGLRRCPDFIWRAPPHKILYRDWLEHGAATPPDLFCTAFFANTLHVTAQAARHVGAPEAGRFETAWQAAKSAFARTFIDAGGAVAGDSQGAYALALAFDLVPDDRLADVRARFVAAVERGGRFTTGIHGTRHLLPQLTAAGRTDLGYDLLLTERSPCVRDWIAAGLTTVPEHWDAVGPDGAVLDDPGNSLNHFALAAVGLWLFDTVGGVARAGVGWSHLRFAPEPGGGLDWAEARIETPYGAAACAWRREGGAIGIDMTVPPNVTADFVWRGRTELLGSGHHRRVVDG